MGICDTILYIYWFRDSVQVQISLLLTAKPGDEIFGIVHLFICVFVGSVYALLRFYIYAGIV